MPQGSPIVLALDFDGTLVEDGDPLRWRRGAKEFVFAASAAGIELVLHSCRCALVAYNDMPGDAEEFYRSGRVPDQVTYSWNLREAMVQFLEREGVRELLRVWDRPGKPWADMYVDDKAELPDWLALADELGVRLTNAGPREPAPMGPAPIPPGSRGGPPAGAAVSAAGPPVAASSPGNGVVL